MGFARIMNHGQGRFGCHYTASSYSNASSVSTKQAGVPKLYADAICLKVVQ
jgi:hypothetical protein